MSFWCRNDPPCVGQAVEPPTAGAQPCNRRGCSGPNDKPRQVETLPSGTRRGRFGLVDLPTDRILTKKEAFNTWTFLVEEHHLLISQLAATQLWLLAVRSWGLPTVWVDNPAVSTFFNILQVPQEPIKKKKKISVIPERSFEPRHLHVFPDGDVWLPTLTYNIHQKKKKKFLKSFFKVDTKKKKRVCQKSFPKIVSYADRFFPCS